MENERGFTLLEMMVVVAIVAILAALLIPNFTRARSQAQTAACEANLRTVATALELYFTDHQQYPGVTATTIGTANGINSADPLESGGYLNSVPHDPAGPVGNNLYSYKTQAAAGAAPAMYVVTCPGGHDPATVVQVNGATSTSNKLYYNSGSGLSASAGF